MRPRNPRTRWTISPCHRSFSLILALVFLSSLFSLLESPLPDFHPRSKAFAKSIANTSRVLHTQEVGAISGAVVWYQLVPYRIIISALNADSGMLVESITLNLGEDYNNDAPVPYSIVNLPVGNYKIKFEGFTPDNSIVFKTQYYNGKDTFNEADIVSTGSYDIDGTLLEDRSTILSISGSVKDKNNRPLDGVTISLNNDIQMDADNVGLFAFNNVPSGTYTLTPTKDGYTFFPSHYTVDIPPSVTDINFVGMIDNSIEIGSPIHVESHFDPYKTNLVEISTLIHNGSEEISKDIVASFYDGNPDFGGNLIGNDFVKELMPEESKTVSVTWELSKNIERHPLYVRVINTSTRVSSSRLVSIYYVDFEHKRDVYSFANGDVGKVNGFADFLNVLSSVDMPLPLLNPVFGAWNALTELNGYCYGMSNSSLVYYKNPILKTDTNVKTYELNIDSARAKIRTYQAYALIPILGILIDQGSNDIQKQFTDTVDQLKRGDPVIHVFMHHDEGSILPGPGTHAVVAYKAIYFEDKQDLGRYTDGLVYYYDSNKPSDIITKGVVKETYSRFTEQGISVPQYDKYDYNRIYTLESQISLQDNTRLIIGQFIKATVGDLFSKNLFSISVEGSGELLATDSSGRRSGYKNGQVYNEIPGAVITKAGNSQALQLSISERYTFQLSGVSVAATNQTDIAIAQPSNLLNVYIVDPFSSNMFQSISFSNININSSEVAMLSYSHATSIEPLVLPDNTQVAPDSNTLFDVTDFLHSVFLSTVYK